MTRHLSRLVDSKRLASKRWRFQPRLERLEAREVPAAIALHPDNPHYFIYQNQPTVLVTSGEHYGAVLNLDFDYTNYFNTLQANGLNLTRVFSGSYAETWGENWNTLNPAANRFSAPWARSSTPGYADGGNKFDLNQWDPAYFARLKDFVTQAAQRGIIVEFVFFTSYYNQAEWNISPLNASNNVNGVGNITFSNAYNLSNAAFTAAQDALVRKVVTELNGYDNVYYEICNEPYFSGNTQAWHQHMADTITSTEAALPKKHLIAHNIANGSTTVTNPIAAVSIFNFHYSNPPDSVAQNYHLNEVISFDESGFRGSADAPYRTEAWEFLIAGGAVYDGLDLSFTVSAENGTATPGLDSHGGSPALRRQLQILKDFMFGLDFIHMRPDNSVIAAAPSGATARALVETGKQYAVYLKGGSQGNLTLNLTAGTYRAEWVDTKTGAIAKSEEFFHAGGQRILVSPTYSADIAVRIKLNTGTPSGLVGHWTLNEGSGSVAGDVSGNGNTGTLVNGPTWTAGLSGSALTLDGVNDYVSVASSSSLNSIKGQMTVAAWVYKTSNLSNWGLIAGRRAGTGYGDLWNLYYNNSGNDEYRFTVATSGGGGGVIGPASTGDLNTWVHLAGVYDGSQVRLYVDGVQVAAVAAGGLIGDETSPLLIGAGDNGSNGISEFVKGNVDDVRVYNRALTTAEIQGLATIPPAPSGLTASVVSSSQINLSWQDTSSNETGFIVERATNSSFTQNVTTSTVAANVTTFQASGLAANTTYYFRVRATNTAGTSGNSNVVSATTQPAATGGLIGHWKLDENSGNSAGDASGNGNAGTLVNGPIWAAGQSGSALSLDGVNDHVRVANSSSLNSVTSQITVAGWVYHTANQTGWRIVATRQFGGSFDDQFTLGLLDNTARFGVHTTSSYPMLAGAALPLNQWVHLAGTFDGASIRLYVNGVQVASAALSGALVTTDKPLLIGAGQNDSTSAIVEAIQGRLDEVRLYSRALTAAEIQALAAVVTVPSAPSNLTATVVSSSQINLSWQDNSNNETGFTVERATDSGFTQNVTTSTVGANVTTFQATGLAASTTYYFRVRATNSAGASGNSNVASGATSPASTGLVGHWQLDEGSGNLAGDASGSGNNGTLVNGPLWTTGQSGSALTFDGVNDYVTVPNSPSLNSTTSQFTVAAWVYRQANQSGWRTVVTRQFGSSWDDQYFLGFSDNAFDFGVHTSTGYPRARGGLAPVGQWFHMVGTYDGSQVRLYVDGVQVAATAGSGTVLQDAKPLLIGAGQNTATGPVTETLQGRIDDIRLYSRALTAAEIQAVFNPAGDGLSATYFNSMDFIGASVTRTDSTVNFDWASSAPIAGIAARHLQRSLAGTGPGRRIQHLHLPNVFGRRLGPPAIVTGNCSGGRDSSEK